MRGRTRAIEQTMRSSRDSARLISAGKTPAQSAAAGAGRGQKAPFGAKHAAIVARVRGKSDRPGRTGRATIGASRLEDRLTPPALRQAACDITSPRTGSSSLPCPRRPHELQASTMPWRRSFFRSCGSRSGQNREPAQRYHGARTSVKPFRPWRSRFFPPARRQRRAVRSTSQWISVDAAQRSGSRHFFARIACEIMKYVL